MSSPRPPSSSSTAAAPADALVSRADWLRHDVAAWIDERAASTDPAGLFVPAPGDDARFDALAQRLFALQRDGIAAYGGYVGARAGAGMAWPLLPVSAFKRYDAQLPWAVATPSARFETSGTSDGEPGVVRLADTSLYDRAAFATFVRAVVPEALATPGRRWRVLCLLPSPALRPHSSLSHMATMLARHLGDDAGGWLIHGEGDVDVVDLDAMVRHVEQAVALGRPVLTLATTLATGLLMERWPTGLRVALPAGSRWMDTGGAKGRTLRFDRAATHAWIGATFGLDASDIVGELGMTELCSQRYEPVQVAAAAGSTTARDAAGWRELYVGPPWLRSVVLDPQTLRPLPLGEVGLVGHIDLANVETCAFVLTADLGSLHPSPWGLGLRPAGRLPGAEWRGCGLAVEDVAEALGRLR